MTVLVRSFTVRRRGEPRAVLVRVFSKSADLGGLDLFRRGPDVLDVHRRAPLLGELLTDPTITIDPVVT